MCVARAENAQRCYKVALMVPLYLSGIGSLDVPKEKAAKSQKSRSLSFLQFYEGFMMAVDAMKEKTGLKLDLTVIDVIDNPVSAENAVSQIEGKDLDLVVGPFFGNAFEVVEEYAKANNIPVVNPVSLRESVIDNNPNVVKLRAGNMGLILTLSNLVKNVYPESNVFIVSREKAADSLFLTQLEHHLNMAINDQVTINGDDFLQFARHESERMEMGSQMVPTLDVEGQVYSVGDFESGASNKLVLENTVKRYSNSQMGSVRSQLSGVRNNLIIAYGDDNVFATQLLNSLTGTANRFPITLVCVPNWEKNEKLLVDNLLKMNAIYVANGFADYSSDEVKRFVLKFRSKYSTEPRHYAFEGYDVATYFLGALMNYGDEMLDCLHCYEPQLLYTNYKFYYKNYLKSVEETGKENLSWTLYQYDKDEVELRPLDPFKKEKK